MSASRRSFLGAASAGAALAVVRPRAGRAAGRRGDGTIRLALIGCGGQGRRNLEGMFHAAKSADVRPVRAIAVCDADSAHAAAALALANRLNGGGTTGGGAECRSFADHVALLAAVGGRVGRRDRRHAGSPARPAVGRRRGRRAGGVLREAAGEQRRRLRRDPRRRRAERRAVAGRQPRAQQREGPPGLRTDPRRGAGRTEGDRAPDADGAVPPPGGRRDDRRGADRPAAGLAGLRHVAGRRRGGPGARRLAGYAGRRSRNCPAGCRRRGRTSGGGSSPRSGPARSRTAAPTSSTSPS